jgi:hypothetical protein
MMGTSCTLTAMSIWTHCCFVIHSAGFYFFLALMVSCASRFRQSSGMFSMSVIHFFSWTVRLWRRRQKYQYLLYHSTCHNIPEGLGLHQYHHENLESYSIVLIGHSDIAANSYKWKIELHEETFKNELWWHLHWRNGDTLLAGSSVEYLLRCLY